MRERERQCLFDLIPLKWLRDSSLFREANRPSAQIRNRYDKSESPCLSPFGVNFLLGAPIDEHGVGHGLDVVYPILSESHFVHHFVNEAPLQGVGHGPDPL